MNQHLEKFGGYREIQWVGIFCEEAVRFVNILGFYTTKNSQTLARRNVDFRQHGKFQHPNTNVANGLKPTSALFEYFPTAEADAKYFMLDHIRKINVVMLQDALNKNAIHALL